MEDTNESYQLDDLITEYIQSAILPERRKLIYSIINTLDKLNSVPELDINFNMQELESNLIEIITTNDEISSDDLANLLELEIKNSIREYLISIGIVINEHQYFYVYDDILYGIYSLFICNNQVANAMLNLLNSEQDDISIIANMLSEFTKITFIDLYEMIDDVTDNLTRDLREYFDKVTFLSNPDIDSNVKNDIEILLNKENMFGNTYLVNDIMEKGYVYSLLEHNLDKLYSNLEKHKNNTNLIPYEIVAMLYMSTNARNNMLEMFKEHIDLGLLSYINNDQVKIDIFNTLTIELINNIMFKG